MKIAKLIASIFAGILIIAIAVNYFIRVSGFSDERSQGIIFYWLEHNFYSENYRNYVKSSDYSGRAINLMMKHGGQILSDDSEEIIGDRKEAINYLEQALTAAYQVEDSYLIQSHPNLKTLYRNKYQTSMELFLKGLQTRNITHLEEAVPVYNEFLALMKENQDKFKRIR